jgi:hypothetical protein
MSNSSSNLWKDESSVDDLNWNGADAKQDAWQHKLAQRRQRVLLEEFSFLLNKQMALKLIYSERRQ